MSATAQRPAQPQRKDDDYDYVPEREAERPQSRPQFGQSSQQDTTQAINDLFKGMPSTRAPPAYMPRNAPKTTTSSSSSSSSGDEARAARQKHVFGSDFSSPNRPGSRRPQRPQGLNFDEMAPVPADLLNPTFSNKPSDAASLAVQQEEAFANYPRLNATYGRTVDLDSQRGRDIVRGIGMLGSLMARNSIKKDFNKQKFHERGGLKRKRLASERWRARFKAGFREVTGRVSELTRKGW
ncbi:hypothetical protein EJ02DRAFT_451873 [Clathrospora elynae]|uniref:Ribosomal protein S21 n=1 Tax=Clathrospora elynae TaxID=706981 RepID=A0A6A5SZD1_9PLEO|nr:hypothetical protein EJ02DRAFT_451873 [Clathrospora elynae]